MEEFIDAFIIISQIDGPLNNMVEETNAYPYIIAVGSTKAQITHFYIEVEKQTLNVS